ncbi:MAG: hypothetical protein AB8B96_12730 [Lysobacterales bacterium]
MMTVSTSPFQLLLDTVSGGSQHVITFPAGDLTRPDIYLLPDLPHLPSPVISPPVFHGDPDL